MNVTLSNHSYIVFLLEILLQNNQSISTPENPMYLNNDKGSDSGGRALLEWKRRLNIPDEICKGNDDDTTL
jgi:hypothetical protein